MDPIVFRQKSHFNHHVIPRDPLIEMHEKVLFTFAIAALFTSNEAPAVDHALYAA